MSPKDITELALQEVDHKVDIVHLVECLVQRFAASPTSSDVLSVREAAQYLGCSTRHLYNLVSAGQLPHVRLGEMVRFRRSTLDAWMTAQEQESTHAMETRRYLVHRLQTAGPADGTPQAIPAVPWKDGEDPKAG